MNSKFIENELLIHAPVSEVWNALVTPELTRQYMFGCDVISSWKTGEPVIWKGAMDGITYVTGHLVAFEKHKKLSFTVFDPNADYEDIPSNYLTASYTLIPVGPNTRLKIKQGDYARVEDGQKRYEDTLAQGGWSAVLDSLKKVMEN